MSFEEIYVSNIRVPINIFVNFINGVNLGEKIKTKNKHVEQIDTKKYYRRN